MSVCAVIVNVSVCDCEWCMCFFRTLLTYTTYYPSSLSRKILIFTAHFKLVILPSMAISGCLFDIPCPQMGWSRDEWPKLLTSYAEETACEPRYGSLC